VFGELALIEPLIACHAVTVGQLHVTNELSPRLTPGGRALHTDVGVPGARSMTPRYAKRIISITPRVSWALKLALLILTIYGAAGSLCQDKTQPGGSNTDSDNCQLYVPGAGVGEIRTQPNVDDYLAKMMADKEAKLSGLIIQYCKLTKDFSGRDLSGTKFLNVSAPNVNFKGVTAHCLGNPDPKTHLNNTCTEFRSSDLTHADFSDNSNLSGAQFIGPNISPNEAGKGDGAGSLRVAIFQGAILDGAKFVDVDMTGATLWGASMKGVIFRPRELPDMRSLSFASHLETLQAQGDPSAMIELHKRFSDAGLTGLQKDMTFAIRRSEESDALRVCLTGRDLGGVSLGFFGLPRQAGACFSYLIPKATLDLTCQFGKKPWRPLWIICWLGLLWAAVLTWCLGKVRGNALLIVFKNSAGEDVAVPFRRLMNNARTRRQVFYLRIELAFALTISSIFNLPFKEIEVGRWLRMLAPREFDFRTRGWVRSFCGCLTLLSFYLFALWIMSLFGEPFSA
jgi:uncharacterized protein YjbI with pentapeptide repeats